MLDGPAGKLMVEPFFTHPIDELKRKKILASKIPALSIDLSRTDREITGEPLRRLLIDERTDKEWIDPLACTQFIVTVQVDLPTDQS